MQIYHLQIKLSKEKAKLAELQNWLINHSDHPNFCLIARDRNAQSVRVETIEFKIGQLLKKLPILGEEIKIGETVHINKPENGFKTIQ